MAKPSPHPPPSPSSLAKPSSSTASKNRGFMVRVLVFIAILFPILSQAKQTICLNMIVKNETRVIKRCLDSVKPVIDYWVIVDTGSTDGTQTMIKEYMKDIPGELYEKPWKNFGENRSEAFDLAKGKGDYILFIDADDILEFDEKKSFPELIHDVYIMWSGTKDFSYKKPQLARGNLPFKWTGVTHEYLDCAQPYTSAILDHVRYVSCDDGARSGPEKFMVNISLLEEGLKNEPKNSRYAFYLAESYRDAGEKGKALQWYQDRAQRGGWEEEVFWSKLQIGHILRDLGLPNPLVIEAYKDAHAFRLYRCEAVYYLARFYNTIDSHTKAYELIKTYFQIPEPSKKDALFNEDWIKRYGLFFELSICAYYVGQYQESLELCNTLLEMDLPESLHAQVLINKTYPLAELSRSI